MDFSDIERILELVREHDLAEFELERDGLKLRVRKAGASPTFHARAPMPMHDGGEPPRAGRRRSRRRRPLAGPVAAGARTTRRVARARGREVADRRHLLPLAPSPAPPSFVEIGQRVKKDQVLCIIEAMKLMNEITSEYDGEIVSAYVENGKPVQYGERLFAIKTA